MQEDDSSFHSNIHDDMVLPYIFKIMANDGKLHTISRQQLVEPGMDANHNNPANIFLNHVAP